MIKTERYTSNKRVFHATYDSYESIWHGFENNRNKRIGYWYQDNRKGFSLIIN